MKNKKKTKKPKPRIKVAPPSKRHKSKKDYNRKSLSGGVKEALEDVLDKEREDRFLSLNDMVAKEERMKMLQNEPKLRGLTTQTIWDYEESMKKDIKSKCESTSQKFTEKDLNKFMKENSGLMDDLAKLEEKEKYPDPFWDGDIEKSTTLQEKIEKLFSSWVWPWKK